MISGLVRSILAVLFVLAMIAAARPAKAACTSLGCTCIVTTTTGLSFGSYDATTPIDNTATGSVTVTCLLSILQGGSYTIGLNSGQSTSFSPRLLRLGASSLSYNLYTASGLSAPVWGDGTGATQVVTGSFAATALDTQSFTVYGRLPAGQNVPVGTYTDAIVVTVTY